MKKIVYTLMLLVSVTMLLSCHDSESYADQKERERSVINKYIADSAVTVISEEQFFAQDSMTDASKNEFVLFNSSGVYMQIIDKGCGEKIKNGETAPVLVRFTERNMMGDSIQLSNNTAYYSSLVDKMMVSRSSGVFSGSFVYGSSLMYTAYSSAAVPEGWLVPFAYVKVGRPSTESESIARVRLIVPHSAGQSHASQNVYPCLYDLTFERGR